MKKLMQVIMIGVILTISVMADELSETLSQQSNTMETYILNNEVDVEMMYKFNQLINNSRGIIEVYEKTLESNTLTPIELKIVKVKMNEIIVGNEKLIDKFEMNE